jgi:hypothetical protein
MTIRDSGRSRNPKPLRAFALIIAGNDIAKTDAASL